MANGDSAKHRSSCQKCFARRPSNGVSAFMGSIDPPAAGLSLELAKLYEVVKSKVLTRDSTKDAARVGSCVGTNAASSRVSHGRRRIGHVDLAAVCRPARSMPSGLAHRFCW